MKYVDVMQPHSQLSASWEQNIHFGKNIRVTLIAAGIRIVDRELTFKMLSLQSSMSNNAHRIISKWNEIMLQKKLHHIAYTCPNIGLHTIGIIVMSREHMVSVLPINLFKLLMSLYCISCTKVIINNWRTYLRKW